MDFSSLPTEVLAVNPERSLGKVYLEGMPQPGNYVELDGKTYTVLERRHRYQFRKGRYSLYKVILHVQLASTHAEKSLVGGRWVVGDALCRFNAHSEVMRCAVNPLGPCEGCSAWESRDEGIG